MPTRGKIMKINEMISEYKRIISKEYSKKECIEIMSFYGIHEKVMNNILELICNQPERLSGLESEMTMRQSEQSNERD